jgi:hypothetical protein
MHPSRIADEGAGGQGAVEDAVEDPLLVLAREMRELFGRIPSSACSSSSSFSVPRIACPTPLQFYRDWVAPNRPVIITGAVGANARSLIFNRCFQSFLIAFPPVVRFHCVVCWSYLVNKLDGTALSHGQTTGRQCGGGLTIICLTKWADR